MNNDNKISDIIISRIYLKKRESWAKVKSLTLGIEIYQKLRDELDCSTMAIYAMTGSAHIRGPQFHGHPIKISHKRPRLIQVNMDIKRRRKMRSFTSYASHMEKYPKFIDYDYCYMSPKGGGNGYSQMAAYYEGLKSLSNKSGISFLTSEQKPAKLFP